MNPSVHFVGCDVGKFSITYFIKDCNLTREVTNSLKGAQHLVKDLAKHNIPTEHTCCVLEHCGYYGHEWAKYLLEVGLCVTMEKTTVLKHVMGEHHRKDDGFDARKLSEYGSRYHDILVGYTPLCDSQKLLRELYMVYRNITATIAGMQTQLQVTTHELVREKLMGVIDQLKHDKQGVFQAAMDCIKQDEQLDMYFRILCSAPGMGPITSWYWLTRFSPNQHLNARKIACWMGTAPHPNQSGTRVGKRRSSGHGDRELRSLMHLCARSLATHNPFRRSYYKRMLDQGKPKQLVINNLINRQLQVLCQLWNKQEYFDPNFQQKQQHLLLTKS